MDDATRLAQACEQLARHPEHWETAPLDQLEFFTLRRCIEYSATGDVTMIPSLYALYEVFAERAPIPVRQAFLSRLVSCLEQRIGTANALYPIIYVDPEISLVAAAALEQAQLLPALPEDELAGPRELAEMASAARNERVRVGILRGLLHLGDRRILPLLDGCWRGLSEAGQEALAVARAMFVYASTVEFYLSWLEQADATSCAFGAIGIGLQPERADCPLVLDVRRRFPAGIDGEPDVTELGRWTIPEYWNRIERRVRKGVERLVDPVVAYADIRSRWMRPR